MAQVLAAPMATVALAAAPFQAPLAASAAGAPRAMTRLSHFGSSLYLQSSRFARSPAGRVQNTKRGRMLCIAKAEDKYVSVDLNNQEEKSDEDFTTFLERSMLLAAVSFTPLLVGPEAALAVNRDFGALEGRVAALAHPIGMGALFLFTLWAGYLGWQWRRVRTIADEISTLKKQIPVSADEGAPASPLQAEIDKLTEERKVLVKGGFRDRHFNAGSILLGAGVTISIGGCLNTWIRTGKLFPGPHLFAGAGITVLWALAAAMVPAMQKGNETARNAHIVLNAVNVVLFIWQIPTGLDIVGKILSLPWI